MVMIINRGELHLESQDTFEGGDVRRKESALVSIACRIPPSSRAKTWPGASRLATPYGNRSLVERRKAAGDIIAIANNIVPYHSSRLQLSHTNYFWHQ